VLRSSRAAYRPRCGHQDMGRRAVAVVEILAGGVPPALRSPVAARHSNVATVEILAGGVPPALLAQLICRRVARRVVEILAGGVPPALQFAFTFPAGLTMLRSSRAAYRPRCPS